MPKIFTVECPRCAYKNGLMQINYENIPKDLTDDTAKKKAMEENTTFICLRCGENNRGEGYGCFMITQKLKGQVIGVLTEPLTEETRAKFAKTFADPDCDVAHSYLTTYNPVTREFKVEFGTMPPEQEEEKKG
jgi:hypothetical protein